MRITPELLRAATGCSAADADKYADLLAIGCAFYSIDTPGRLAAFLAQLAHESGSLRYAAEIWGPTPEQARYEGRADLGNTEPGDGQRFKGRALIQATGRANYARVRDRLRERFTGVPDFEAEPQQLATPQWAVLASCDYWDEHGLNALADAGRFIAIGRKINRGNANSKFEANGEADRIARWARAQAFTQAATPAIAVKENTAAAARPATPAPITPEGVNTMPLPAIIGALLPSIIDAIPKLGKLFGSGSEVAERNVQAAELAVNIVQEAVGARNAQEAAEIITADPAQAQVARAAIERRWLDLDEAGGDGIAGARKADTERMAGSDKVRDVFKSHSFWISLSLLPLVYLLVLSLIGMIGTATWSDDVRAGLAGSIVSAVIGGLVGYYFGQTTSRNRSPA